MARTKTAPWDYRQRPPTIAELRETNTQLKYYILINQLERSYGIDFIANIVKSWGDLSYAKKLEQSILLEYELEHQPECTCVLPGHSCPACDLYAEHKHGDSIPYLESEV